MHFSIFRINNGGGVDYEISAVEASDESTALYAWDIMRAGRGPQHGCTYYVQAVNPNGIPFNRNGTKALYRWEKPTTGRAVPVGLSS